MALDRFREANDPGVRIAVALDGGHARLDQIAPALGELAYELPEVGQPAGGAAPRGVRRDAGQPHVAVDEAGQQREPLYVEYAGAFGYRGDPGDGDDRPTGDHDAHPVAERVGPGIVDAAADQHYGRSVQGLAGELTARVSHGDAGAQQQDGAEQRPFQ